MVLFIYDLIRLAVMVGLLQVFLRGRENSGAGVFPYLPYAAPNALFPLMALFIWVDPETYRVYFPLYMAGKTVGIGAFIGWTLFSLNSAAVTVLVDNPPLVMALGLGLFLVLADIGAILGVRALSKAAGREGPVSPDGETGDGGG
jgi:hypothetical protein